MSCAMASVLAMPLACMSKQSGARRTGRAITAIKSGPVYPLPSDRKDVRSTSHAVASGREGGRMESVKRTASTSTSRNSVLCSRRDTRGLHGTGARGMTHLFATASDGKNDTSSGSDDKPTDDGSSGGDDGENNNNNNNGGGGGGDGDGDDENKGDDEGDETPEEQMRSVDEVIGRCEKSKVNLPEDIKGIAEAEGLRASVLDRYVALSTGVGGAFLTTVFTAFPAIRDRALQDPAFLWKLGVEVFGDLGLSIVSEMKGRNTGDSKFGDEAEFFFADVLASAALNAATLTMLSPTVRFGLSPGGGRALRTATRVDGKLNDLLRLLFCRALPVRFPASAFQKGNFSIANRAWCVGLQGVRVGGVSVLAGFAGQAAANGVCRLRRKYFQNAYSDGYASCIHPEAPPLLEPAAEWGAHMAASGNVRQQLIIGVESAIESSAVGLNNRVATRGASAVLRLANNAWGGAAFAERMRVMEAEVYGADEVKKAAKESGKEKGLTKK
jgi:hypothetical protein